MRASARRLVRVHRVTAERRQLDPVDDLVSARARLCELARDAPDLDDRQRRAERQHRRHLQQDLQLLADRDRRHLAERLDAVARLEQERAALGHLAERAQQVPRLAGEHERRQAAQALADRLERSRIGPVRLLSGRQPRQESGVQVGSVTAMLPV